MLASLHFRLARRTGATLLLVLASGATGVAGAADTTHERVRLAATLRQLDAIERVLEPLARRFPGEPGPVALDYPALLADLEQARARIRTYLTPPRAQPVEPVELQGVPLPSGDVSELEASP